MLKKNYRNNIYKISLVSFLHDIKNLKLSLYFNYFLDK